jgi:hypothetical protein
MKYNPFRAKGKFELWGKLGEEIVPPKYVYHIDVTGGRYRLDNEKIDYIRMNIAKEGLFGKDMGNAGVWANIYQSNPYGWYPIKLDLLWDCRDDLSAIILLGNYDVWRIDTTKIKNKWYFDPNMLRGEVKDLKKVLYTPDSIPGKALKLFHMELDKDILYDYKAYRLAELMPYKKINDFIRYTHRRKRIYLN